MAVYSMDLRSRIIADRKMGIGSREGAVKYSVSRSWVNDLWRRFQETGSFEPKKIGGYRQPILNEREQEIRLMIEEKPDITLKEIGQKLSFRGSLQTISNAVSRLGFSFKKNSSSFRTRQT